MASEADVQTLAIEFKRHVDGCGKLQAQTAKALRSITKAQADLAKTQVEMADTQRELVDKFKPIDQLVKVAWRALGAVLLAVVVTATGVMVQNYFLHRETQTATVAAASKLAATPSAVDIAAAAAFDKQDAILTKLDQIQKSTTRSHSRAESP